MSSKSGQVYLLATLKPCLRVAPLAKLKTVSAMHGIGTGKIIFLADFLVKSVTMPHLARESSVHFLHRNHA